MKKLKSKTILFIIFLSVSFLMINVDNKVNAAVSPMNVSSNTTMANGIKINVNGTVRNINDVINSQSLHLNVYAPTNVPDSTFYNMMLAQPICWQTNSQMIITSGTLVDALPSASGAHPALSKAFDLRQGYPSFRLTKVSKT